MAIFFVAGFVLIRVGLRVILGALFGADPADDPKLFYIHMAVSPLAQYLGTVPGTAQFPPLVGVLMVPAAWLSGLGLSHGDAFRFLFAAIELCIVWRPAAMAIDGKKWADLAYWCACPPLLLASTVFVQDEIFGALVLAIALRAREFKEAKFALAMTFGVIAAKIFFAPVALLALFFQSWKIRTAAIVLLAIGYFARLSQPAQVQRFLPGNDWGVSPWSFSFLPTLSNESMYLISLVLAFLVAGGIALALTTSANTSWRSIFLGEAVHDFVGTVRIAVAGVLILFVILYHVNPEYYLLPFMLGVSLTRSPWESRMLLATATFPYLHNVLNGLAKLPFQDIAQWAEPISFSKDVVIAVQSILVIGLVVSLLRGASSKAPVSKDSRPALTT